MIKTISVSELKRNFSKVLKELKKGEKYAITMGRKKEIVAYLTSYLE